MEKETGKQMRGIHRIYKIMKYYYPCFLLHFLLGLSASSVLLLSSAYLTAEAAGGGLAQVLYNTDFDLREYDGRSFSCVLLEDALYMPEEGMLQPAFAEYDDGYETGEPARSRLERPALPKNGLLLWGADEGTVIPSPECEESESDNDEKTALLRENLYTYDRAAAGGGEVCVIPMDLSESTKKTAENGGILFSNQTSYTVDGLSLLEGPYPIPTEFSGDTPVVLVIHTHGSEAFAPEGAEALPAAFAARSRDCGENTVAVGDVFCGELEAAGIPVLHCRTMFDCPSYTAAYPEAAKYIRETVGEYPSILYVFDIHRDALATSGGDVVRPVTVLDGEVLAQVMIVVGTNEAGADYPDWREHLTAAVKLQDELNRRCPTFARPINLRSAAFNAQYAPGSMLLEIGASGNSLGEAKAAAAVLGRAAAAMIRGE